MASDNHPKTPVPIKVAARCLGVKPADIMAEIAGGEFPSVKVGETVLVHVPTAAEWLANKAKGNAGIPLPVESNRGDVDKPWFKIAIERRYVEDDFSCERVPDVSIVSMSSRELSGKIDEELVPESIAHSINEAIYGTDLGIGYGDKMTVVLDVLAHCLCSWGCAGNETLPGEYEASKRLYAAAFEWLEFRKQRVQP